MTVGWQEDDRRITRRLLEVEDYSRKVKDDYDKQMTDEYQEDVRSKDLYAV